MKVLRIGLLALCLPFISNSQTDFRSEDLSHLYDRSTEIELRHSEYFLSPNKVTIYLHLILRSGIYALDDYKVSYIMSDSYSKDIEQLEILELDRHIVRNIRLNYFARIELDNPEKHKYLFLFLENEKNQKRYAFDIMIDPEQKAKNPGILLWDYALEFPYLNNYLRTNDSLILVTKPKPDTVFAYYYNFNFDPAEPPMTERSGESQLMTIDSTFTLFDHNTIANLNPGLYLLQKDTNSLDGLGIHVHNPYYPEPAKIEDLIDALIYFSSKPEWLKLKSAQNKKLALDSFWITIAKSKSKAKRLIKLYYDRVENANRLFTSFKEGWKTDKGMIYIIKGKPDVVHRNGEEETWLYTESGLASEMKFTFLRVDNIFNSNHWALIRDSSYSENWFYSVDQLRNDL